MKRFNPNIIYVIFFPNFRPITLWKPIVEDPFSLTVLNSLVFPSLTCCLVFLLAFLPVLKCRRLSADVAVAMRSSGGRGARGPDCELTVILLLVADDGRGLPPPDDGEDE